MKADRFFSIGIVLAIVLLISGCSRFNIRGLFRLSLKEERELGQMVLLEIKRYKQFTDDYYLQQYLEDVGQRIVAQIGPQPFGYSFYVLNDPNINAFAIPAGHIFVYSGLINMVDNESELAGVLSHEIGHVTARHIAQQIEKASKLTLPTIAAVLAGIMVGGGGEATEAVILGTIAGEESLMLKYSREDEEEADRLGLSYLTQAGYDPCDMVRFLFKLMKEYGIMSSRVAYNSTHPETIQRITYLENMVSPSQQCWGRRREGGIFKRMQARSIIETRGAQSAINYFNQQLREDPRDLDSLYGLALAHQKEGNLPKAIEIFKGIIAERPEDAEVRRDLGILYFDRHEFEQAAAALEKAVAARPEDKICLYYLGRNYEEMGDLDRAIKVYQQLIGKDPNYAPAYRNLGLIYDKKGLNAQSHANLGTSFELEGDRNNALFHYNKARELYGKDSEEAKKMEEKIKELGRDRVVDRHR